MGSLWKQIGGVCPMGIPISQSWYDIGGIFRVIQEFEIKVFIELGAAHGGLSAMLAARATTNEDFHYIGYEVTHNLYDTRAKRFLDGINRASYVLRDIRNFVPIHIFNELEGRLLVFCDNGHKPAEFAIYCKLIKPGDFIMAHDYPTEIKDEDCEIEGVELIRHNPPWMKDTNLILFERK